MMNDEMKPNMAKLRLSTQAAQRSLVEMGGMTSARVLPSRSETGTIS